MNRIRELFLKWSRNIVYGLFAVIVLYLFLLSLFGTCVMGYTDEHVFFVKDFPFLMLAGLLFLVVLMVWGRRKADAGRVKAVRKAAEEDKFFGGQNSLRKWILPGITACWFVILIIWIRVTLLPPMHDQYFVFYGQKSFWKAILPAGSQEDIFICILSRIH